ncbi:MAG: hypothetical protein ACRDM7_03935 [Thermoleophilaceae bacterium]
MSYVVKRVAAGPAGMWSRVKLDSGDQVMVSMARHEVKLLKMKWGGLWPGEALATLDAFALVNQWNLRTGYDPLSRSTAVLDHVTADLLRCTSIDEVREVFARYPARA